MIDITGTDLRKFIAKAYELSQPQGMGIFHFKDEPIPEATIDQILSFYAGRDRTSGPVLNMDYVHGRAVKMSVYLKDGKLVIGGPKWYDHNDYQLEQLLSSDGVVNNGEFVEADAETSSG